MTAMLLKNLLSLLLLCLNKAEQFSNLGRQKPIEFWYIKITKKPIVIHFPRNLLFKLLISMVTRMLCLIQIELISSWLYNGTYRHQQESFKGETFRMYVS